MKKFIVYQRNELLRIFFLVSLFGSTTAYTATWRVDDDLAQYPSAAYTTIQAAVNAASSGDTILVYPGTYDESIQITKPLTLLGAQHGRDARSRKTSPTQESRIISGANYFVLLADNIVVDGFWVIVDLRDEYEGVGLQTSSEHSGYRIINNIMDADGTTALVPGSSGQIQTLIRHNLFLSRLGIAMDSELGQGVHNVVIEENLFQGASMFLGDNDYSDIWIVKNKWIEGGNVEMRYFNIIDGISNYNITFRENKFYNCNYYSISLRKVFDVLLENNIFRNGSGVGIWLNESNSNLRLVNNRISHFQNAGIQIGGTNRTYFPLAEGNVISNNEIEDNGNGIVLYYAANNAIQWNNVEDNDQVGIFGAEDSENNLIEGNEIRGNGFLDAQDSSTGAGTAGTANTWIDNEGSRCTPTGICTD